MNDSFASDGGAPRRKRRVFTAGYGPRVRSGNARRNSPNARHGRYRAEGSAPSRTRTGATAAAARPRPTYRSAAPKRTSGAKTAVRGTRSALRGRAMRLPRAPRSTGTPVSAKSRNGDVVPPLAPGAIRIIPLGGVEEIGRNMTAVEIGNDILVIDCGFQFKEVETPGIDYILPNTKYLEDNKDRVRALFITHGHLDHIGGIPFIIDRIGLPPIYTRNLTAIMVKKRQFEFPHLPELDIRVVERKEKLKIGDQTVRFFGVTHTIPDSMGIIIDTPHGPIVAPGDFKLEHMEGVPSEREEEEYKIFDKEKVLLMLLDSTNVENPGFSTPEKLVHESLEKYIKDATGRLIIGTFASQMERMISIVNSVEKYKKKIVVEGRSMKQNIEIAKEAGMIKIKPDTIISATEAPNYPKSKIIVLATGAQGEEFAALMRMANKSHKQIRIEPGDTVLLSASIIPGNEKSVERLKDNIARQGGKIISYRTSDVYVHSTGHGNRGELEWLHRKIKPKFFIPVHGNHYRLKLHAELAMNVGMPPENVVVPDNSSIIEIMPDGEKIFMRPEKVPSIIRLVDGLSVGDIQEVVMKDRQTLAEDGIFVVIAMLNVKTGTLKKSPDIISRGFIYLRESQDLLQETRLLAKKSIEEMARGMNPINFDYLKKNLTEEISAFLLQKTHKHPIVVPVLLGV